MGKNIIIYSDGTGQRGGLLFDEHRSNIYKLYRATRCAPDSFVDPSAQLAFYDPGLGTLPPGGNPFTNLWRRIYNIVSQATGLGLTGNIIDCYAAIIRMWQSGDRIFVIGFSRGAYTVRSLAAVISFCGVPTRMKDRSPLKRDVGTSQRIAAEGVRQVYQHTTSRKAKLSTLRDQELLAQRKALAARFRQQYASGDSEEANAHPHFVGVFDTVASLANPVALAIFIFVSVVLLGVATAAATYFFPSLRLFETYFPSFLAIFVTAAAVAAFLALYLHTLSRIRVAFGLQGWPWYRTLHLAQSRVKFYDRQLSLNVAHARHAISIDECRASFERVPWGTPDQWKSTKPEWFKQVWFAGNHSDIGGSYPENESRLSDIALKWMLDEAGECGLIYDPSVLRLYPDASGPQHDETLSSFFKYAKKKYRVLVPTAPLHPSVLQRFDQKEVLHYDTFKEYRPEPLRKHREVAKYYDPLPGN